MNIQLALALVVLTASTTDAQVTLGTRVDRPFVDATAGPDAAVGDVDGDGDLDVITASTPSWFLENLGDGTFAEPVSIAASDAFDIELVDIDNDGALDIARPQGHTVHVYRGKGDGTFFSGTPLSSPAITPIEDVALADFNGDGNLDYLMVAGGALGGPGSILLGLGDGVGGIEKPALPVFPATNGFAPQRAAVGDLDGTGLIDFVVVLETAVTTSVLSFRNVGAGIFQQAESLGIDQRITDLRLADISGDGIDDLLVIGAFGFVSFVNNGDGTFKPFKRWSSIGAKGSMSVADFDGDGVLDVGYGQDVVVGGIVFGSNLVVLRGTLDGTFEEAFTRTGFAGMIDLVGADFDGDSRADVGFLTTTLANDSSYTVLPNVTYAPSSPWLDLAQGLASDECDGIGDKPFMIADGSLVAGTPFSLTISRNLAPQESAFLIVGASESDAPFKGGTLVPTPTFIAGPFPPITEVDGTLAIEATTPVGLPAGVQSWIQTWFIPGAGQSTFSATNAIVATTP